MERASAISEAEAAAPRAGYRERPGPPGVLCLWLHVVGRGDGAPTRVLPDGCTDLIWQSGRGAFVAGPDTRATLISAPAGSVFAGARFGPGAGGPALGVPLEELRDARIAIEELPQSGALRPAPGGAAGRSRDSGAPLAELLDPELSVEAALRRVAWLAAALAATGQADALVGEAARRLREPATRVEALAGDLGLGERQLRRRFRATVGYPPKTLQRVLRSRRFLAAAEDEAEPGRPDLGRLAFDAGYADQAHLSRDCARLSGLAPGALLRARAAA